MCRNMAPFQAQCTTFFLVCTEIAFLIVCSGKSVWVVCLEPRPYLTLSTAIFCFGHGTKALLLFHIHLSVWTCLQSEVFVQCVAG